MARCAVLTIISSLLCCHVLHGQKFEPRFKFLNVDEAPIIGVMKIYQDKAGYIWIGSRGSLTRYDGHKVRSFVNAELSNHYFQSDNVNLIFESPDDRLWAATDAGALLVFDRELDRFNIVNDSVSSLRKQAYSQLTDADGNFWITTLGAGLFHYNPVTGALKNVISKEGDSTSLPSNVVVDIIRGRDNNLWVATNNGLCKVNPGDSTFTRVLLRNNDPTDTYRYRVLRDLHAASDGKLYISSYRGLHVLDYATLDDKHILSVPGNPASLSHNSLFRIAEDASGFLWIATYGGGINRYDPATEKFSSWQTDTTDPFSIASNNIFEVSIDHEQQLWVGTADEGVCVAETKAPQVHAIRHHPTNPGSIPKGLVRQLWVENDSIAWMGYNGAGLVRLNYLTGHVQRFVNDPLDPKSIGHNAVTGISKDRQGNIWVGLEGGGVNKLDLKTKKFTRLNYQKGKNSLSNDAVSSMTLRNDSEQIWITSYIDGIDVYNKASGKFTHLEPNAIKERTGVSPANIYSSTETDGEIWFFSTEGLIVFNKADSTFTGLKTSSMRPRLEWVEMDQYAGTILLLSSNNQLYRFRLDDRRVTMELFYTFASKDRVTSIAVVDDVIWGITNKNIIRYTPESAEYFEYDPGHAIFSRNFLYGMMTYKGKVFFTTEEGLNWFYDKELNANDSAPRVVLTDFKVFNSSVVVTAQDTTSTTFTIPQHISVLNEIDLSHREAFFSFEFTSMEYYTPERIQYEYQMKGFDKNWINIANRKYASYTNLDPGTYTFLVRATNGHGDWVESKPIRVVIHPPFWKTAWFIAMEIIAVLGIIYAAHRYKVAQTVKLERLRNKIASDLHDEVGSSLTRISLYSDMLEQKNGSADQKKYLHGIHRLSREVISTMSDIVWSVDNRSDSLGDLILRMKDFANEVLSSKNIEVAFDVRNIDEKKVLDPALKQNLYLIFKESINNIVKHAEGTKVLISITNQHEFKMEIHDNGKGFGIEGNHKGHGLRNMNRRASNINAKLDIQSHGKGTVVQLQRLPL
jgi:signal transduction histidine kinase/streptogramin lyase